MSCLCHPGCQWTWRIHPFLEHLRYLWTYGKIQSGKCTGASLGLCSFSLLQLQTICGAVVYSLVPSLPDLFLRVTLKMWEWPGDETSALVQLGCCQHRLE